MLSSDATQDVLESLVLTQLLGLLQKVLSNHAGSSRRTALRSVNTPKAAHGVDICCGQSYLSQWLSSEAQARMTHRVAVLAVSAVLLLIGLPHSDQRPQSTFKRQLLQVDVCNKQAVSTQTVYNVFYVQQDLLCFAHS